jgi:hypothetical protein
MLRRWLVGGLTVVLLASALLAKPGVVTTRQGDKFTGDVTEDDKFIYIDGAGGQIKLDKRNIANITYTKTIDDQYAERHAKLAADDVKGRMDLADWASQNQRTDLAVAVLTEARKIDPMNKDAARALDAAEQQLDMEQLAARQKARATTGPATGVAGASPTTQAVAAEVPLERRQLNADEINLIRQKEMQADDSTIRVRFENNVINKYLSDGDHDKVSFRQLSLVDQASEILAHGDPKLAKDVRILTDPAPLLLFRQKINPIVAAGCGSSGCHGGTKAGDFALYTGDSTAAVYTNFYILFTYTKSIDGVKYLALDREVPERSLVLQYGLRADGKPAHPRVPGFKPRFKNPDDPAFVLIDDWLSKSLAVLQPNYGIKVASRLPGVGAPPSTQPARARLPVTTAP